MRTFIVPAGTSFEAGRTRTRLPIPPGRLLPTGRNLDVHHYSTVVIAQNDDRGLTPRTPGIQWTNNVGVSREVSVVVYAYTFSGRGTTATTFRLPDGTTETSKTCPPTPGRFTTTTSPCRGWGIAGPPMPAGSS